MYYSFPAFARLAGTGNTTGAPSVKAAAVETHEAIADPAMHAVPKEQSAVKTEKVVKQ
jgi:hypothetical protein